MREALLEAWRTHDRINRMLLDAISDPGLTCTLSTRGGRDVAGQLAHLHNVRVQHLERRAKDLAKGLEKFPARLSPSRHALSKALDASGEAIGTFLSDVLLGVPKRRGFKKGIFTTLAYFVAHESHHRGGILLTLKSSGHAVDKRTRDAIWGWDQITP